MLSKEQEQIITISAYTAQGNLDNLKIELAKGLDAGLTISEIKEMIAQAYAYCGFPRAIRGLQTFMSVLDERKTNGINDTLGRETSPITDTRPKYERGKEILAELQGISAPEGRPASGYGAFCPEIDTFLKEHLFADIFERDVLTYAQREMVTVSILMSMVGVEPMLSSHMNLALNVGVIPDQLKEMIEVIKNKIGHENAETAQSVLNELMKNKNMN